MIDVHGVLLLPVALYAIAIGISSLAALWMAYSMFWQLRLARWVEDTPTSKIRSAAQGLVEVTGQLAAGDQPPLHSPLSGEPCLWYRFRVEEYCSSGSVGRSSSWRQIDQGVSVQPLLLQDNTGCCWIMPEGAEVHPCFRRRWEGRHRWPLAPSRSARGLGMLIGRRYRYTEERLQQGDLLYVLGWFESRGGGREAGDLHRLTGQIIRDWKADYTSLLARFDRDKDGRLDQQEWQQVQAAASEQAQEQLRSVTQAPEQHVLSRPPYKRLPFVLSSHPEEGLSRRLRRQSGWRLLGLLATGSLAVWFWLALA